MDKERLMTSAQALCQPDAEAAAFEQIDPFLNWLISNIPIFVAITDGQMAQPLEDEPSHG